jgi:hypothetical protein
MSTRHTPSCGLSKQEVLNWRENGLPEVVGGRCQNPYDDAYGVEHLCGRPVGEHLSGGNIFFNLIV